jgi:RHS repeat-associated protein
MEKGALRSSNARRTIRAVRAAKESFESQKMRVPPSAHRPAAEDRVPSSTFASSSTSRGRRTAPDRRAEHAVFHGENTVETSFFTVNVQVACGAILAKTRVRASAEKMPHCTRPSEPLSSTSRWGWTACSYEIASARLVGHFYPYGQEKPSATTNGTEKFTGYFRDAETTLDYAKNRFHNPGTGRFLTPDPSTGYSPSVPGSWNKYAYVQGDPVNNTDRSGLYLDAQQCAEDPDACLNEDWGCAAGDPFAPTGEEDPDCEDPQPFQCPSGLHDNGSGQCVPNAPPPPTCEEQLDDEISNYLVAQNSPLAGYVSEIIGDAENDGINPLLLVAIAGAESSYGNSKAAQKTDNAFGLLHAVKGANGKRQYVLINFLAMGGDWSSGISLAANVVTNQFTKGNNTVNLLYSGNVGAYCVNSPGQNCSVGAGNVSAIFSSFQFGGGNPNNAIDLLWPCNPLLDGFR